MHPLLDVPDSPRVLSVPKTMDSSIVHATIHREYVWQKRERDSRVVGEEAASYSLLYSNVRTQSSGQPVVHGSTVAWHA